MLIKPLKFAFFESQLDEEDFESSDEEDGSKKTKVYVPPKVAAVPYGELSKAIYFIVNTTVFPENESNNL